MTGSLRAAARAFLLAAVITVPAAAIADSAITVTDASGRKVTITDTSRIVSVGGDITEILYALKAGEKIAAVDSTSQFPPEARRTKPVIGYMRALPAEGVIATNPTLILAAHDAGPADVVKMLKSSSVPYVGVPDDKSPEGAADKIRFIATAIGKKEAGEALAKALEAEFAALAKQREKITDPVRALFVLTVMNGRATVAGTESSADAMLKLAGAKNAAADITGYKPIVDEAAMQLAPDAIVTMKHSSSGFKSDDVLTVKGLKESPAGQNKRIIEMDALYFLGFGPRSARAAGDLMHTLYPKLAERPAGE